MHHAGSIPEQHIAAGFLVEPTSEVFIRRKDDRLVRRHTVDYFFSVAAGADDIAQRFDLGSAVDVGDHDMVRMFVAESLEKRRRRTIGE
jgi:hypothetical protein